jgi:hypothetical protein
VSNINYASINENFPVAGQDNDTQVFRDNFDTIKTSLRYAKEELEVLQNSTDGSAILSLDNNFQGNLIQDAVFKGNKDGFYDNGSLSVSSTVYYKNGNYQKIKFGADVELRFDMIPIEILGSGVAKMTVELSGDGGASKTITIRTDGSTKIKANGFSGSKTDVSQVLVLPTNTSTSPMIIEVWQYRVDEIFLKYVGQFA